ncbi:hypothetical protein GEMRC1_014197 [Eukaryota sp. GEM-RC1]
MDQARIEKNGPIAITIPTFESLFHYTSGIYTPIPGEVNLGYHAVVVVGFNDAEDSFTISNSWGREWGRKGSLGHVSPLL